MINSSFADYYALVTKSGNKSFSNRVELNSNSSVILIVILVTRKTWSRVAEMKLDWLYPTKLKKTAAV